MALTGRDKRFPFRCFTGDFPGNNARTPFFV